jgi:cyclophilin family peptidyl-prolyl cis-trans isomerase
VKRMTVNVGLVVLVLGVVFVFSQFRPERMTAATLERSALLQERLAQEKELSGSEQTMQLAADTTAAQNVGAQPVTPTPAGKDVNVVKVKFETSKGAFVAEIHQDWAPNGAGRFLELVKMGFFTDNRFFRVVSKPSPFVVQWGIPGDPKLAQEWWDKKIPDDPVKQSNAKGMLTFAAGKAKNSRSTQLFISLKDNKSLDSMGLPQSARLLKEWMWSRR